MLEKEKYDCEEGYEEFLNTYGKSVQAISPLYSGHETMGNYDSNKRTVF